MTGLAVKKIVVPYDFSDLSFDAVDRAIEIADPSASIDVVHVLPELAAMEPSLVYGLLPDEKRIAAVVDNMREKFADERFAKLQMHCLIGDTGHQITKFADEQAADLIVIPSHGYGFVKHVLLGSVAERVVRMAHCPVLVLRS